MNEVLKVHWIGPYFLFFVRAVLPERAIEALLGGAPEVGSQVLTKNSCRGRFHGAEWSCIVLSDSPRRRNGSGRDWPYKSAFRTEVPERPTTAGRRNGWSAAPSRWSDSSRRWKVRRNPLARQLFHPRGAQRPRESRPNGVKSSYSPFPEQPRAIVRANVEAEIKCRRRREYLVHNV